MIKSLKVVILQLCYFICVEIKMLKLIAMNLSGTLSIIIWLSKFSFALLRKYKLIRKCCFCV